MITRRVVTVAVGNTWSGSVVGSGISRTVTNVDISWISVVSDKFMIRGRGIYSVMGQAFSDLQQPIDSAPVIDLPLLSYSTIFMNIFHVSQDI